MNKNSSPNTHETKNSGRTRRHSLRKRRGVGVIIGGTLLAMIVFTSFFAYFMTIMQTQTEKGKTDVQTAILQEEKDTENFVVNTATCADPCTSLPIIVNNTGSIPLNATYAIAFPVDDPETKTVTPIKVISSSGTDQVLNSGQSAVFAVPTEDNPVDTSKTYHVDIITSRGNIVSAVWTPSGSGNGGGSGSGSGSGIGQNNTGTNIGSGQGNVYAGMDGDVLQFKRLAEGSGITISETGDTITIGSTGGSSGSGEANDGDPIGCYDTVPLPANCANFYAGKSGVHLQFSSLKAGTGITLTSDGNGNWVIDSATLGTVVGAQNVGSGEGQVYRDTTSNTINLRTLKEGDGIDIGTSGDLITITSTSDADQILKPQISGIFPNPYGTSSVASNRALWGAVVANPSDHPMVIRKLVISAHDPTSSSPRILCQGADIVAVTPGSTWSCEGNGSTWNVMQWKGSVTIAANSAQLFLAQSGSPLTAANADRPSIALNYNIYTDFGQYSKVGYDFGLKGSGNHPMINTFLSNNLADKTPANVIGVASVVGNGVNTLTLRASIANYVSGTTVDAGASIVIYIPRAFTTVTVDSFTGFNGGAGCATATAFSDGSHQIKCTLTSPLSGTAPNDVRTVQFKITAPSVTSTKEYPLYVLGEGTTDAGTFTMGPVSENIIRVTP